MDIPIFIFAHELNGVHKDRVMGLYQTSSWKDNHDRYDLYSYSVEDIEKLKKDLKHDKIKWNASCASRELIELLAHNIISVNSMEKLLYSDDHQQRQYTAWIIRRALPDHKSDKLYEIIVESLADDNLPFDGNDWRHYQGATFIDGYFHNGMMALTDLMENGHYAKHHLINGLYSDDDQLSFFCAVILGENKIYDDIRKTVEVLCKNLKNDKMSNNACMAMSALFSMGEICCPYLNSHYQLSKDDQEKECILLLWKYLGFIDDEWDSINFESYGKISYLSNRPDYFINYNKKTFILGGRAIWYSHYWK